MVSSPEAQKNKYEAAVIGYYRSFPVDEQVIDSGEQSLFVPDIAERHGEILFNTAEGVIKQWTSSFNYISYLYLFDQGKGLSSPTYSTYEMNGYLLMEMKAPFHLLEEIESVCVSDLVKGYISVGYIIRSASINREKLATNESSFYLRAYEEFLQFIVEKIERKSVYQLDLAKHLFELSFVPASERTQMLVRAHKRSQKNEDARTSNCIYRTQIEPKFTTSDPFYIEDILLSDLQSDADVVSPLIEGTADASTDVVSPLIEGTADVSTDVVSPPIEGTADASTDAVPPPIEGTTDVSTDAVPPPIEGTADVSTDAVPPPIEGTADASTDVASLSTQRTQATKSKSSDWYAVVYSRTYRFDYQYLAAPDWLDTEQRTALQLHVNTTLRARNKLYGQRRWSISSCKGAYFVGITCLSNDISKKNCRDASGREIPLFLGYATKKRPKLLIGTELKQYEVLYRVIDKYWETKKSISSESIEHSIPNEMLRSAYQEAGVYSHYSDAPYEKYELNMQKGVVRLWRDSDEARLMLWKKAARSLLADGEPSICLGLPSEKEATVENPEHRLSFPFMNITVSENMTSDKPKDVHLRNLVY